MQTKQNATKNPHSYSNALYTRYTRDFFVVEGFLAKNVQNFQFLLIRLELILISIGAVFLMR